MSLDFLGEDKQSHENRKNGRKCKQENVLQSYYDEENSRSEHSAYGMPCARKCEVRHPWRKGHYNVALWGIWYHSCERCLEKIQHRIMHVDHAEYTVCNEPKHHDNMTARKTTMACTKRCFTFLPSRWPSENIHVISQASDLRITCARIGLSITIRRSPDFNKNWKVISCIVYLWIEKL